MNTIVKKIEKFRTNITELEGQLKNVDNVLVGEALHKYNPLKHMFGDGCYVREINTPADQLIVTKIHKKEHPFFLLKGECSMLTEDGIKRISAPYYNMTLQGTKRIIYTHTDLMWVTVHVTESTDLEEIEKEVIAENFDDPAISIENLKQLKNKKL